VDPNPIIREIKKTLRALEQSGELIGRDRAAWRERTRVLAEQVGKGSRAALAPLVVAFLAGEEKATPSPDA
jgi:hypothetical protein